MDPVTLAKFKKLQAMLAESPEIFEALTLNSPEILALAALAQAEKKHLAAQVQTQPPVALATHQPAQEQQQQQPVQRQLQLPEPEPYYPTVGLGHSDDVSVMSEMSTPTVMTRQAVEQDEFYPEVNTGTGTSSSGLGGGPHRIGMKIGVTIPTPDKNGSLPPPPPKTKKKVRPVTTAVPVRRGYAVTNMTRQLAAHPMYKISEHDGSQSTESTEPELNMKRSSLMAKKKKCRSSVTRRWKPPSKDSQVLPPAFRTKSKLSTTPTTTPTSSIHSSQKFKASSSTSSSTNTASPTQQATAGTTTTATATARNSATATVTATSKSEAKKTITTASSSDDKAETKYVRQIERKSAAAAAKPVKVKEEETQLRPKTSTTTTRREEEDTALTSSSGPDPNDFKNYLFKTHQEPSNSDEYLPGTDPFAASRKQKDFAKQKKSSVVSRVDEWMGSGKTQKRSWKVKGA